MRFLFTSSSSRLAVVPLAYLTVLAAATTEQASAAFATFDSFAEGVVSSPFTDGGITFSAPKDSSGGGSVFTVEQANATLSGPFFTPNNALALGGFSSGPGNGFPAIGSFKMTTGGLANAISVEMFYLDNPNAGGNVAELNLFLSGSPVGSTSFLLPGAGGGTVLHQTLSVSGVVFDEAQIDSSGAFQNGAYFAVFDSVRITTVPEPGALGITIAGVAAVAYRKRKERRD